MNNAIAQIERFARVWSRWFNWVAGAAAVAMMLLLAADIIGIKIFKAPVPGAIEIVGYISVILVAFALAQTLVLKGHIQIDFLVNKFSPRLRAGVDAFIYFLDLALFAVIAWQSLEFGLVLQRTGEVSMTQGIPYYPFVYALALSSLPVCLVLVTEIAKSIRKAVQP